MKTNLLKITCLLAALLGLGGATLQAASITNADAAVTLNLAGSWVGGVPPGSGDVAVWDSTVQNNLTKTLGASASWGGIQFLNPGGLVTVGADGNTLTLGASGIDLSDATTNLTLSNPVILGANQSWNVTNGQTLTVGGIISGAGWLTLNGGGNGGTVVLNGADTYTGGTLINSGIVVPGVAGSFGTAGVTNNNGTLLLSALANSGIIANTFTIKGTTLLDMNNRSVSQVLDGAFSGSGTIYITNDTASGSTLTLGGNGNGGGSFNAFTGSLIVVSNASGTASAGTIRFNNGGASANLGNPLMTLNLGNGNIHFTEKNSSTTTSFGALYGGNGTELVQPENYVIGGLNLSTLFAGTILNASSLTKNGTGVLTLTGNSTYTGATTVNAGILQVGDGVTTGAGALGTGAFTVGGSGELLFNKPDNFTVANNISGAGVVVQTNVSTLTYNGNDTGSGSFTISEGTLALGSSGTVSAPVYVAGGAFYDVSANGAYALSSSLSGSGTVIGPLTAVSGSINPGSGGVAGTLTISNGLTESGNINNNFVLSTPGGTNDLISVAGNLTVSGTNNVVISAFGGGTVPLGVYPLFTYTGTLTGGTNNFLVTAVGVSGIVTNITTTTPAEIAVIVVPTVRGATNLTWKGDGAANNWDLVTSNWFNGVTSFNFQTGDKVLFSDAGTPNTTVNVAVPVLPAAVVASNTLAYTLTGPSGINGATSLIKTNSGVFSIIATNSYTGPTIIGGGTLAVYNLANGGSPSAIGAALSGPTNLVLYGATLAYDGVSAATDRGLTLDSALSTLDVTNGVDLTLNGVLTGPGALNLVDTGTLTLASANTYAGGTVLKNGVLALGSDAANNNGSGGSGVGATNEPVTFNGGTLQLYGVGLSSGVNYNTFYNPLVVPAGQTGTLVMFPRGAINTGGGAGVNCSLSGGGTLTLEVNYVRDALSGDWSAFSGLLLVTNLNASGDEFRLNNNYGYANATIFLNGTFTMDSTLTPGATINIGALGGVTTAVIGQGTSSEPGPTWSVGWNNTTNTFAGTIEDDNTAPGGHSSITKVGTGIWYLSGQNTYTGNTTISNGVLALTNNAITFTDGSIADSTNIFINAGAFLDVSGLSTSTMSDNAGQVICGYGTIRGTLDTTAGGAVSGGGGINGGTGILTVTNNINLGGVAWMKVDRTSSPTSDKLVSSTAGIINLGGTLVVTNIGGPLQVGDTFTLFSAPTLTGSFGTIILPNYYTWDTSQVAVNGKVKVTGISTVRPAFAGVDFSQLVNGTVTLNAANGAPNGPYTVLSTTNLALPLGSWTVVGTGNFDGSGNLSDAITVNPAAPQEFYILEAE